MAHTSCVPRLNRRIAIAASVAAFAAIAIAAPPPAWRIAVDHAAMTAPAARIVVVDIATGRLLATHHLDEARRTLAAPGSTLKPLILYSVLASNRWDSNRRIVCNRRLVLAGHRLACSHPTAPPFDAREALTWSCNTYFAEVARSFGPGELGAILRPSGLLGESGLARDEAIAEFSEPRSVETTQLTALGVAGIRVTPLELAAAYRWLARELAIHADSVAAQTVRAGLEDSASFGMAGPASLGGVPVAGKTGTAENVSSIQTHGWFVALAPSANPQVVIAIYLPAARGAGAARLAADLLAASPLRNR